MRLPFPAARGFALLLAATLLASSLAAAPDDDAAAKDVFNTLFAAKLKAAAGTLDRADDVALAKEMLALAQTTTNQPALVALLCEGTYELGQRAADGYTPAADAMQLLSETVEAKRTAARDKLISILTRQGVAGNVDDRLPAAQRMVEVLVTIGDEKGAKKDYADALGDYRRAYALAQQKKLTGGDEVKAKLEWATARDKAMKQIARLQEKLQADANDHVSAEEIVKLYVIEMDDPASAVAFLDRVKDELLKRVISLCVKAVGDLSEDELMLLGEWSRAEAATAAGDAKARLWRRATACFERFLSLHSEADVHRTKATGLLKEATAQLAAIDAARQTGTPRHETSKGRTTDVLKAVLIKRDVRRGAKWTLEAGALRADATDEYHALYLPYVPKGDYKMRVKYKVSGGGSLEVYLSRPGMASGYIKLTEKLSTNFTVVGGAYSKPQRDITCVLDVVVTNERTVVSLDGTVIVDHRGSPPADSTQLDRPFRIGMNRGGKLAIEELTITE